jgi:hypothetical protein
MQRHCDALYFVAVENVVVRGQKEVFGDVIAAGTAVDIDE